MDWQLIMIITKNARPTHMQKNNTHMTWDDRIVDSGQGKRIKFYLGISETVVTSVCWRSNYESSTTVVGEGGNTELTASHSQGCQVKFTLYGQYFQKISQNSWSAILISLQQIIFYGQMSTFEA